IFVDNKANLTITGVEFNKNTSYYGGGAIYIRSGSQLKASDSIFSTNDAVYGGAILAEHNGTKLEITDTTFAQNIATNYGGGLYIDEASASTIITIEDAKFENNSAKDHPVNGNSSAIAKLDGSKLVIKKDNRTAWDYTILQFFSDAEFDALP
ncbi:MAG: hypothetical protein LBJ67_01885, partial [Planctomycetaceae bacterium]|nr:hypothetical protein [Planctomycetaceae bacterium]